MKTLRPLYKIDSKGKMRVWYLNIDPVDGIQVIAGLLDGKQVQNSWKAVSAKNAGRANETTVEEQIEKEALALYDIQTRVEGYWPDMKDAGNGKSYFAPMLAEKYDGNETFPVFVQPKLDGFRCNVYPSRIHSREGEPYLSMPHIEKAMLLPNSLHSRYPSIKFDGELYHHDLKDDFSKLQSLITKRTNLTPFDLAQTERFVQYHVYDFFDTENPFLTFQDRTSLLAEMIEKINSPYVVYVPTMLVHDQDELLATYAYFLSLGYEGQMLRDGDSIYEVDRRSKYLRKHKPKFDCEVVILDIKEGVGNWKGCAKNATVYWAEGDITTDTGLSGDKETNREIFETRAEYIGTLATIEHEGITKHRKFRFPVIKKWWKTETRLY